MTQLTGAEAIVKSLRRNNVDTIFALPGGQLDHFFDALYKEEGGLRLISYLLFESGFTRELIDMGFRDALEMEEDLRAFLFDQTMETTSLALKRDLFFETM